MYKDYIKQLKESLNQVDLLKIKEAEDIITKCYKNNGNIYIIGNGGSATTSSHWACDFGKISVDDKRRISVYSLTDNNALLTAISNDINYKMVFEEQLKNLLESKDLLVGISASGNSENVINAFKYAKKIGSKTLSIVGFTGGKLKEIADYYIYIPCKNYGVIEDIQLAIGHMISQEIKIKLMKNIL